MIGVKNGQFIQGGLKVRLDEMGVGDRRFSVDHEIVSKERSTSVIYQYTNIPIIWINIRTPMAYCSRICVSF